MKHSIRQHGQLTQIECELGTGILDKNGREIFEGDKLSNGRDEASVIFINGAFGVRTARDIFDLGQHFAEGFEVVGHVDD